MGALEGIPHAVLVPFPAQGHFPPMVYLARKIADLGLVVTLVIVDSVHEQLQQLGSCSFPKGLDIRVEPIHINLDCPRGWENSTDPAMFGKAIRELEPRFQQVVEKLMSNHESDVCCVIYDHYIGAFPSHVAAKFSIPSIIYWPGTASWFSLEYHIPLLASNGDIPITESDLSGETGKIISHLPGLDPLEPAELPTYLHESPMKHIGIEVSFMVEFASLLRNAKWVLANSFEELEPTMCDTMEQVTGNKLLSIGPLFPVNDNVGVSFMREDRKCLRWLENQAKSSVLYISFGSATTLSRQVFEELALGVEASQQSFIWSMKPGLVKELSEEFLVGFTERTKNRGMLVPWTPQREILTHGSTGAFLTHCGWNSLFESIWYGVPMLGLPCHSEQAFNCKLMVEKWKVGLALRSCCTSAISKEEVESMVRALFSTENNDGIMVIRERAIELRDSARRAAMEGGSSYNNLEAFLEEMKKRPNA